MNKYLRVELARKHKNIFQVHEFEMRRFDVARVACTVAWKRQNFFDFGARFLKNETLLKKSSTQNPSPEQFPNDI